MNTSDSRLTVAIPTYNRRDALLRSIHDAVANGIADSADLLVFDDGSTDGTAAAIQGRPSGGGVAYVRKEANQGYARAYLELLERCTSRHLMLSADDDFLVVEGIRALTTTSGFLDAEVISTVFERRDGTIYRGRQRFSTVSPDQLRQALNHAPGIVYATDVAREFVGRVRARLDGGCSMAATYPQVLLGLLIAMDHRIVWAPVTTVREGAGLPSGITDASGASYFSARSRIAQLIDFDTFLVEAIALAETNRGREFARNVLRGHRKHALPKLVKWIGGGAPHLADELTRQASLLPLRRPRFTLRAWAELLMSRRERSH